MSKDWEVVENYGLILPALADRDKFPELLVVFVHGFSGNFDTWDPLIRRVFGDDIKSPLYRCIDLLNFKWPASPFEYACITKSSEKLRRVLDSLKEDLKHEKYAYIFVTHSTGGLVVKQALAEDWHVRASATDTPFRAEDTIAGRTLRVVNFAVPHDGAGYYTWWFALPAYLTAGSIWWLPNEIIRRVPTPARRPWKFGFHHLAWQLLTKGPWIARCSSRYNAVLEALSADHSIASPPSHVEICAASDTVIENTWRTKLRVTAHQSLTVVKREAWEHDAEKVNQKENWLIFEGTHTSIKHPEQDTNLVTRLVAKFLAIETDERDYLLSFITVKRIDQLFAEEKVNRLLASSKPIDSESTPSGGQIDAVNWLVNMLLHSPTAGPCFGLTGDWGVGKSIVGMQIARDLCAGFLRREHEHLCLFVPLAALNLPADLKISPHSTDADIEILRSAILAAWLDYAQATAEAVAKSVGRSQTRAKKRLASGKLDSPWLRRVLSECSILIFDGIDEFCARHNIEPGMLAVTAKSFLNSRSSQAIRILFIGRSTTQLLDQFVERPREIFSIRHITKEEAKANFPSAWTHIQEYDNKDITEILYRPMIIKRISGGDHLDKDIRNMETRFIDGALKSLISDELKKHAPALSKSSSRNHVAEALCDAISIIVWIAYTRDIKDNTHAARFAIPAEAVKNAVAVLPHSFLALKCIPPESAELLAEIASILAESPHEPLAREKIARVDTQLRSLGLSAEIPDAALQLSLALVFLANEQILRLILSRTIFNSTPTGWWRASHDVWQDFCLSRCLWRCIQCEGWVELERRAFKFSTFERAGHLLERQDVPHARMESLRDFYLESPEDRPGRSVAAANVCATIANCLVSMERRSLDILFQVIDELPDTMRLVAHAGLSARAIRGHLRATDQMAPDRLLVDFVRDHFATILSRLNASGNPILASITHCAWRWLAKGANSAQPFVFAEAPKDLAVFTELVAEMVSCRDEDDKLMLDPLNRTIQAGFFSGVLAAQERPDRVIAALHYLLVLSCAYQHHVAIPVVENGLRSILAENSDFERAISKSALMPELVAIFALARRIAISTSSR